MTIDESAYRRACELVTTRDIAGERHILLHLPSDPTLASAVTLPPDITPIDADAMLVPCAEYAIERKLHWLRVFVALVLTEKETQS